MEKSSQCLHCEALAQLLTDDPCHVTIVPEILARGGWLVGGLEPICIGKLVPPVNQPSKTMHEVYEEARCPADAEETKILIRVMEARLSSVLLGSIERPDTNLPLAPECDFNTPSDFANALMKENIRLQYKIDMLERICCELSSRVGQPLWYLACRDLNTRLAKYTSFAKSRLKRS